MVVIIQSSKFHRIDADKDNRFMWLDVDSAMDASIGDRVCIGSIKAAWIDPKSLEIKISDDKRVFTITQIRCDQYGKWSIEIAPAIILDAGYINCTGMACLGDEVTKYENIQSK